MIWRLKLCVCRPMLLFFWGFQSMSFLFIMSNSFRRVCPNHAHLHLLISLSNGCLVQIISSRKINEDKALMLCIWWTEIGPRLYVQRKSLSGQIKLFLSSFISSQSFRISHSDELLRCSFWFQNGFSQKDEKDKFDNSVKFAEKKVRHFLIYLFVVIGIELSNINGKCWENCNVICLLNVLMTVLHLRFDSIL